MHLNSPEIITYFVPISGLLWETDANGWYYDGEPYLQQHIPYWNDYQPNIKAEQTCTVRDSDGLTMENCENNKHPFVCTYPACPKGKTNIENRNTKEQSSRQDALN